MIVGVKLGEEKVYEVQAEFQPTPTQCTTHPTNTHRNIPPTLPQNTSAHLPPCM